MANQLLKPGSKMIISYSNSSFAILTVSFRTGFSSFEKALPEVGFGEAHPKMIKKIIPMYNRFFML
ncbi:hypothetical protein D3C80_2157110 [compost metagenome]